ncbi:hypothetical protein L596_012576 [Steinernema carpocapsae]|uniref:Uncharacterized protein n=1 Tax=Steinernema carpocapsae TaxID=34508 RepID=A0A4U5NXI0_STECR|nr:hypothetical protein L596_012576 [Steinernema carpocapsae]
MCSNINTKYLSDRSSHNKERQIQQYSVNDQSWNSQTCFEKFKITFETNYFDVLFNDVFGKLVFSRIHHYLVRLNIRMFIRSQALRVRCRQRLKLDAIRCRC